MTSRAQPFVRRLGKGDDAKGEMLINGVPAKLSWQRIFDAAPDKQPPLRVTASIDNSDRTQLGLDINHMVQGEVASMSPSWPCRKASRRCNCRPT